MKKFLNSKYLLVAFLIALCVINLVQGYFTELLADEAYYWVYSNFLDWGYFDHPPMVAVWITISKFLFNSGELSVRFFSAITLSVNFYLIWLLIKHPKKAEYTWLYILIVLSTALFNVYGFITVPDTPLMLFITLFLIGYQKYLQQKSFFSYLLLVFSIVGMLYCKYTSVLIFIFVIASNFKLVLDYKLWLVFLCALLLYIPHLHWQYINDYPSFRYHLFERSSRKYSIDFTTNHFLNLVAIIGFTFPIMYLSFFKNLKNKELFQKALNFIIIGFAVFFFISSFKDHVQAQWIVPISIPLIIITFNYLVENKKFIKPFKVLSYITIGIIFILRFFMLNNDIFPIKLEVHDNKKWVSKLENKIGNHYPVFINSYQNTSTYWFYSGKRPYQYNTWSSRKNQYDLLKYNKHLNLDSAIVIQSAPFKDKSIEYSIVNKREHSLFLSPIKNFEINKKIKFILEDTIIVENGKTTNLNFTLENKINHLKSLYFFVVFKSKDKVNKIVPAKMKTENSIEFICPTYNNFSPVSIQVVATPNKTLSPTRLGTPYPIVFVR